MREVERRRGGGIPRHPSRWTRGLYEAARDASWGHRRVPTRRGGDFPPVVTATRGAPRAQGETDEQHQRSVFIMGWVCHPCLRTVLLPMSPTVHVRRDWFNDNPRAGLRWGVDVFLCDMTLKQVIVVIVSDGTEVVQHASIAASCG
jgi:hypothetical protein